MILGFAYNTDAGATCELCEVADSFDLASPRGFREAVLAGCAQLAWNPPDWEFRWPPMDGASGVRVIQCRPRG